MRKVKMLISGKARLIDIWHYFLGWYRYNLYYARVTFDLKDAIGARVRNPYMRKHIDEQITYRLRWMDVDCYLNGSCKICGCETTALQMANKSCDKPCYPPMMNKQQWESFKAGNSIVLNNKEWIMLKTMSDKPIFFNCPSSKNK